MKVIFGLPRIKPTREIYDENLNTGKNIFVEQNVVRKNVIDTKIRRCMRTCIRNRTSECDACS